MASSNIRRSLKSFAPNQTYFQDIWLQQTDFKPWLIRGPSSTSAMCKICSQTISLSNMGKGAVESHHKGKKHQDRLKELAKQPQAATFLNKRPVPVPPAAAVQQLDIEEQTKQQESGW